MSIFGALSGSLFGMGGMAAGGIIGSILYPGIGTAIGITVGGAIGGVVGGYLFPQKIETSYAPPPRIMEGRVQPSAYGLTLPYASGTMRLGGIPIWMGPVIENYHIDNEHEDGADYDIHTKIYNASFAVAFCMGPVTGISRIWLNNELFVDFRDPDGTYYPAGGTVSGQANFDASLGRQYALYTIYLGAEDQAIDPVIAGTDSDAVSKGTEGAANTQAYRGICMIVFEDFNVGEVAGLPNVEAEVVVGGSTTTVHATVDADTIGYTALLNSNHPWTLDGNYVLCDYLNHRFIVMDKFSETVLSTFTVPSVATAGLTSYQITGWAINPFNGWLWVCCWAVNPSGGIYGMYRRNLIYYSPNGSLKYDSGDVAVGRWESVYSKGILFEPNSSGRAWELFLAYDTSWSAHNTGFRQINDSFSTVGPFGYRFTRWFKSDGSYNESYNPTQMEFSCDGTYFYCIYYGDLGTGLGTTYHLLRVTPGSLYNYDTTDGGRIAIPYGGWTILDYGSDYTDQYDFPAQWSNGNPFPVGVYSPPITQSDLWLSGHQIGLYTSPGSMTPYNRTYITDGDIPLSDVITELCELTGGLTASDIDVSALTGLSVLGYSINRQMPARTAIEPLMVGFNVDCGEEDWKIKFKTRGGTSVVDIPTDDLAARMSGSAPVNRLVETIQQDPEIPTHLSLNYISKGRDYERSIQHSFRNDKTLTVPMTIDIPIVMTDIAAKQLVEISHQILYQSRRKYNFTTSMEYVRVSPMDLAVVGGKLMRIVSVGYRLPLIEFNAESEEGGYVSYAPPEETLTENCSHYFDGTGSGISSYFWGGPNLNVYSRSSGIAIFQHTEAMPDWQTIGDTYTIFTYDGDFDVQIDWSLSNLSALTGGWCNFYPDTSPGYIGLWFGNQASGDGVEYWYEDDLSNFGSYITADRSGKFRVTRTSGTLKGYVWNNGTSQWEWNGNTNGITLATGYSDSCEMILETYVTVTSGPSESATLSIDNYITNSGCDQTTWP